MNRRITLLALIGTGLPVLAESEPAGIPFFESRIRPVLIKHCYECHSARARKVGGKLLLDTRDGLLRGGESGPALVPGKPEESLLIEAIRRTDADLAMPPEENAPLPEAVVHDFVQWVVAGAPDPRGGAQKGPADEKPEERKAALWSFQPITRPEPPGVQRTDWPRDPLDHFVLARLEAEGLAPVRDAPPETLLRRLYFDLVGLAPTFGEVQSFVAACERDREAAVAGLVDRLLASPQFGERWGRHWLDVARYGESNGNDGLGRNPTFPHAWRYRDYVIQAFNNGLPYDRFLMEQIAGDLLPAATPEDRSRQLVATGFLAIGAKPAAAMNQNFAMDVVDDQVNVVSSAVMGLSVACARCHDHKHDPIAARDYYALAGIFTSTETLWGKAANENLTAPATPLHDLGDPKQSASPAKFAKGYGAAIDALKPALHARLDAKPKNVVVEKGVSFPKSGFAVLNEGRLRIEAAIPPDNYTVSFWFRSILGNTERPITAYLFSHAVDGKGEQGGDHIGIGGTHEKDRSGKLFIWDGTKDGQSLKGSKELAPGSWNHLVMVREGKRVRLYLNGDPEPELDGELTATAPEEGMVFVGARNDRFAPLLGSLSELALFDRALTAEEAQTLHKASGQKRGTPQPAFAMGVRDKVKSADCKINIDGNSKKLGPVVPRGFLPACRSELSPPTIGSDSSGRLQLADWLTRGDHPQTARVMANRIWLHLIGRGIVTTPDDFGVYGARPSHPALLDHLARRFMADDWSIKTLIRNIVLSRTYQLDSGGADEELFRSDSDNVLVGRHSRRRLDAEALRDRILQAGGTLTLDPAQGSAIEGVDILLNWPPGEAKYLHGPSTHRSVYLCMLRNAPPPELAAFNLPAGTSVTGQRSTTTPPTQALFLLNNPLVVEQSRSLASSLLADAETSEDARVFRAYRRVLQRDPRPEEITRALAHIREQESELSGADATVRAWASFCQALLASSEFRYID